MSMSTDYYLKEDLKMEPAAAQAIKSLIHLPWNIKPVRARPVVSCCVGAIDWCTHYILAAPHPPILSFSPDPAHNIPTHHTHHHHHSCTGS